MGNYIREIELNFCNDCTADCFICSKPHGSGNVRQMTPEVFNKAIEQLRDVKFEQIQTSGNGDAFLNPSFFDYLETIHKEFSSVKVHFYSNFRMFDPSRVERIIEQRLIDKVFVRIDSLNHDVFRRATKGLDIGLIKQNIQWFLMKRRLFGSNIELEIMYSSIPQYYKRCRTIIGKEPYYSPFSKEEVTEMKDEYEDIKKMFGRTVSVTRMNQSLWAERIQAPRDEQFSCPKINQFERIIWINPDGTIDVCGYDDEQSKFIAGSIFEEHILDIWNGARRQDIIEKIKRRWYKEYPCINPRCCSMINLEDLK